MGISKDTHCEAIQAFFSTRARRKTLPYSPPELVNPSSNKFQLSALALATNTSGGTGAIFYNTHERRMGLWRKRGGRIYRGLPNNFTKRTKENDTKPKGKQPFLHQFTHPNIPRSSYPFMMNESAYCGKPSLLNQSRTSSMAAGSASLPTFESSRWRNEAELLLLSL